MSERMEGIWERVREKQALELAAVRLCGERGNTIGVKLSLSAVIGLVAALWPVTGAALAYAGLM